MSTLKDVAKRAKCSSMTVSRAINEPDKVTPKTLKKVRAAIKELNYIPNFSAQNLRNVVNNKSIGVLALDTATTPFDVEITLSIEETARKYGWTTFIMNVNCSDHNQTVDTLLSYKPTGIIYTTMGFRRIEIPSSLLNQNLVLANCIAQNQPNLPAYIPDDYLGQYRAISKLATNKKYQRVLCLFLSKTLLASHDRYHATLDAWKDANRKEERLTIHFLEGSASEFSSNVPHFRQVIPLLENYISQKTKFDCIVCGNDRIAFLVYQTLLKHGIVIPDDIGVLGYDNMVGICDLFVPPLTTVKLPHYTIGEQAALHIINNHQNTLITKIDCPLIIRESL